jgi:RsiW-degrading membrane proteinase PrsW (M82 family)
MALVNHYSFILAAGFLIFLVAFALIRKGFNRKKILILGILVTGLIVIWFLVRPTQNVNGNPNQSLTLIGNGTPVLLEYQSPY